MTTFIIITLAAVLWITLTVFAALFLAAAADDLYKAIKPKRNQRKHTLGKWLRFHGQIS